MLKQHKTQTVILSIAGNIVIVRGCVSELQENQADGCANKEFNGIKSGKLLLHFNNAICDLRSYEDIV